MELPHKAVEVLLPSAQGELEALLMLPAPEPANYKAAAVVCHPHPLYGGSLHSKVVVTISHAFLNLGIPSLRFNFRGVGRSSGRYDNGTGEQDDVIAAIDYMAGMNERILVAGHSFGAWVGMKVGCGDERVKLMIGAGVPVNFADMSFLRNCKKPMLFIHGALDDVVPLDEVEELYSMLPEPKKLVKIEDGDHFFTGKLEELSEAVKRLAEGYL